MLIITKVLIINTVRFRLNGITSVIMNYYRNMKREDMLIDFVVHNEISDEYKKELSESGARVFRLPPKKNPLKYQKELRALLKKNRYDVVHVHGNSAMMLLDTLPCKQMGVKKIIVHSHNTTCNHVLLHKLLIPVFRMTYTDGLACGKEAGIWLFGNHPFTVLRNGIDLNKNTYDPQAREVFRRRLNAGDRCVIGHIGNFIEQKNHVFLIDFYAELLKQNPNYLLVLISDGELMEMIREKVKSLHIEDSVCFVGKTTQVADYLQAMDVMVLPSLHEGLPVVLIEAQAAGLHCIVSDKVTKEADLTNSLCFLPLQEEAWVQKLLEVDLEQFAVDRAELCHKWQMLLSEKGYDVTRNAQILKKIYAD